MVESIRLVHPEGMVIENEDRDDEPFIEYNISSYPSDFTLEGLHSQWKKGSIVIPPFQREFVWSVEQASLLIDSFMMGLPVPPVFLYLDEEHKYLVIDGQQRLLSVCFFFEGFFGEKETDREEKAVEKEGVEKRRIFRLQGINSRSRYAGQSFAEFSENDRRKIEGSVLRAINIRQINPSEHNTSVYHIFERLNTGGTSLRPQEIRNCVFFGEFLTILKVLNEDDDWRKIVGKPTLDKYQKDLELILRLFAFLERGIDSYEKPMKEYLNKVMKRCRNGRSDFVTDFKIKFRATCKKIIELLGEKPFHVRGPMNAAYLDAVFCVVYDNLERLPPELAENYVRLKHDVDFNSKYTSAGTQDTSLVKGRFERVRQVLLDSSE